MEVKSPQLSSQSKKEEQTMQLYKAIRTGLIIEVLKEEGDQMTVRMADGEIKTLAKATIVRWYKPIGISEVADAVADQTPAPIAEPVVKKIKAKKIKVDPKPDPIPEPVITKDPQVKNRDTKVRAFLEKIAKEHGCALYSGKVKVFVSVKLDGVALFVYTYNTEGINIWMRSLVAEAVPGLRYETKNHMFDARIKMNDQSNYQTLLPQIFDACLGYQKFKLATAKTAKVKTIPLIK